MRWLAICSVIVLHACANLSGQDARRIEADARTDDAKCVARELAFPSDKYVTCRLQLSEQRQEKQRQELGMASVHGYEPLPGPVREVEGSPRLIDPARFRCAARGEGEARVIFCEEK